MTEVIITVTSSGVTLTVQQGQPGVGVPSGGDIGQTLVKLSNANYDTGWASAFAGGVTEVATGSGLTGGPITSTGTVSIDFYSSNTWYGYAAFNGDFEISGPTFNNSAALTAFSYQTIFYGPTEQRGTVLIRPSDVAPVAGQVLGASDTTGDITWITPNVSLTSSSSFISSNVNLSTSAWTTVTSLSLAAGTWLVTATATITRGASGVRTFSARIASSTTTYASSSQGLATVSGNTANITCTGIVTIASTTTVNMQATTNTTGSPVDYAAAVDPIMGSTGASGLVAVRLA